MNDQDPKRGSTAIPPLADTSGSALVDFTQAIKTCCMCKQQPLGPRHFSTFGAGPFCSECWHRYMLDPNEVPNTQVRDGGPDAHNLKPQG